MPAKQIYRFKTAADARKYVEAEVRKMTSDSGLTDPDALANLYGPMLYQRSQNKPKLQAALIRLLCEELVNEAAAGNPSSDPLIRSAVSKALARARRRGK